MTMPSGTPGTHDIARVAYAIWEAEGHPEGRDHEHWMRAKQLLQEGRAEIEFPALATSVEAPRPVQPGFEGAAPGMAPRGKADPGPERPKEPRDRSAKHPGEVTEPGTQDASGPVETPGVRNPAPIPPANAEGYVAVPSVEDVAAFAVGADPQPLAEDKAQPSLEPMPTQRLDRSNEK